MRVIVIGAIDSIVPDRSHRTKIDYGGTARFVAMSAASRKEDHPNDAPGVPMVFPPLVERLQIKYFNPMMKPIARYLPTFAVVKHRGRTSGTEYETVVNVPQRQRAGDRVGPRQDELGQERTGRR
jgi:hypothetical protein